VSLRGAEERVAVGVLLLLFVCVCVRVCVCARWGATRVSRREAIEVPRSVLLRTLTGEVLCCRHSVRSTIN
jgi:hypothetical protein